jgi:hypothetical protein
MSLKLSSADSSLLERMIKTKLNLNDIGAESVIFLVLGLFLL